MDLILLIPGITLGILLFVMLNRRFKLIKLKKPHIDVKKIDNFILNLGFIGFFCMIFLGIHGFDWRIAYIICGIAGLYFCYPREDK